MTLGDLLIRIGADVATFEALKGTLGEAAEGIKAFAESTESMAIVLEANVTRPLEQAGEALVSFGEDFKTASNNLILGTGAIGDQLAALKGNFADVFSGVNQSAGDVSTAIATLATRLNLAGEPLEELTKKLLELANITGEQVAPLVQDASKLFAQWSVDTEDQSAALDHLLQVASASGGTVKSITDTLLQFGPAFRELGLSLDDTTNLIGNLQKAGVNVDSTLSALQRSLNTMSKAGLKDPLEGLQLLIDKIAGAASEGQAFQIGATAFGKGAATIVNAIREGKFSLDDFQGSLNLSTRTVSETAEEMETLGQQFDKLKNALETDLKPVADSLLKFLEDALTAAKPLVDLIGTLASRFSDLPEPVKEVAFAIAGFLAALGPILGVIAGAAAALDALAIPAAGLVAILGGPTGLVVVAAAFGVALAAWAIYDAVTKAEKLITTLDSLYDTMQKGGTATAEQADQIQSLTAVINTHNKTLGAKPVTVSQTDANDNILPNDVYIKNLQAAVSGLQDFKGAQSEVSSVTKDATGVLTVNLATLGDVPKTAKAAGDATKTFSADSVNAYAKLMAAYSQYKQITEEIKKLQEAVGVKSLPIKQLQLADLQRQVRNPTATDADNQTAAYYSEIVKLNRAANIQTSDDTLQALADLQAKLKIHGMDTQQAFSLLGVTSTADIDREVSEITAAEQRILSSSTSTNDDRVRATSAALDKEIALWRQSGQEIDDSTIQTAAAIKATWAATHLDIAQAFQDLGVTSSADIGNALTIQAAALAKIQASVAAGSAQQVDADNAEIASLTKKAAAYATIGQQMSDAEVTRLKKLKQDLLDNAMTTDQAFQALGLPSQDDLDNEIALLETAFQKIRDSESTSDDQVNAARAAELGKMIADYRAAGKTVTDDMLTEWKQRTTDAQIASMDIDQAFKLLGVVSTVDAQNQLALLDAAFKRVSTDATSTAADINNALAAKLQATITALKNSGQAASDELVHQLDAIKTKIAAATMTIEDAYKQLGVTSTESLTDSFTLATAALKKIEDDAKSTAFDDLQAFIGYQDAKYKYLVSTGQQTNDFEHAQGELAKQRLQAQLADQQNIYLQFADTIKTAYTAIQNDLADVITGAKSLGQAFADIGKQIEQAIVKFIINNLILTKKTLDSVTDSLEDMLHALLGGGSSSGSSAIGAAGSGAIGLGDEAGVTGAGAAASGSSGSATAASGGIISSLSGIATVVGAVASVLGSIVQGFQMAHLISIADKIEHETARLAIYTGDQSGNSVQYYTGKASERLGYVMTKLDNIMQWYLGAISDNMKRAADDLDKIVAGGLGDGGSSPTRTAGSGGTGTGHGAQPSSIPTDTSSADLWAQMQAASTQVATNAYSDLSTASDQLATDTIPALSGAADSIDAASTTLTAASGTLATAATGLTTAAEDSNTLVEQLAAKVAPAVLPVGGSNTFTPNIPGGPIITAPAAGGPGPSNALVGQNTAAPAPTAYTQPVMVTSWNVTVTGNTIASDVHSDQLMNKFVEKIRTVGGQKISSL